MATGWGRTRNMIGNIQNPLGYWWYKLRGSKGPFTFSVRNGIKLEVPRRLLSTFKEMFFRMPYFEGLPKHIVMGPSPLVIDIGANVGYFSMLMLSKYPDAQVHAFEPYPPNLKLLRHYAAQHPQLKLDIHPYAVAGQAGTMEFHYNADDEFSTSAALVQNGEGSSMQVAVRTMPDFLNERQITAIDWLKVDCEGAEYSIFRELPSEILQQTKIVTIENHDSEQPGETQQDLVESLKSQGFQVHTNGYSPLIWAWRT